MDYKEFLKTFGQRSGFDFCDYSECSISRRLQKICTETGMSFEQILDRVVVDKNLVKMIVEAITVNTTELFRDPSVWVSLGKSLYRQLPKQVMSTIWHAGCSTGLEVYSDLILIEELGMSERVRVIGTDVNPSVLEAAKAGVYNLTYNKVYIENFNLVMLGLGLSATFDKYFEVDESADTITVRPELRKRAIFLRQDLVKDKAPFPYKVDIVFLRNVIIYFNAMLQMKVLREISDKLFKGGSLVLGKQEDLPLQAGILFGRNGAFYKKK